MFIFLKKEGNMSRQNGQMPPNIQTRLRHNILKMPDCIRQASGIVIYGRRIKSIVFTTDLAIIRNCDADAVFAVYPFTPQQVKSNRRTSPYSAVWAAARRRACARCQSQKT